MVGLLPEGKLPCCSLFDCQFASYGRRCVRSCERECLVCNLTESVRWSLLLGQVRMAVLSVK